MIFGLTACLLNAALAIGEPATRQDATPPRVTISSSLRGRADLPAAVLLEAVITRPGDAESRRALASHYGQTRQIVLATFFNLTLDFLENRKMAPAVPGSKPSLDCHIQAPSESALALLFEEVLAAQRRVADEISKDEKNEGSGLAASERAIQLHGAYCPLVVEWAYAYLWFTLSKPSDDDAALRELAIRELVTLGEANVFPIGKEGQARTYMLVADAFATRKDYVSAYVALRLADEWLRAGSLTGLLERNSVRAEIGRLTQETEPLAYGQQGRSASGDKSPK